MARVIYDLILDESGSFAADNRLGNSTEFSLVGGLLCKQSYLTDQLVNTLLPERVHCNKKYKKSYLSVLEKLYGDGCRFVIFENRERLKIINSDVTYLNVMSEGLIQLLHDLRLAHPDDQIIVMITIALRKEVTAGYGVIQQDEYRNRLEERILLATHRENMEIAEYHISFSDARAYRKIDFADIICNTWFTRKRSEKFTEEEQTRIGAVYDPRYIYSVFQSAEVSYLKRLLSEERFGELMAEMSAQTDLRGIGSLRSMAVDQITRRLPAEQEAYYSFMSQQLGRYNSRRMYWEGIALAENYSRYFLSDLESHTPINERDRIRFWRFDTDFYLLTMYDHIGHTQQCEKYLQKCRKNIRALSHSWEHIDYYFRFRIRELNCLMGQYDFDGVLKESEKLVKVLKDAKEAFSMVEVYDDPNGYSHSELLGKVYGIRVEAYTNLVIRNPELFDEGMHASELALAEFELGPDEYRQRQYRCALLLAAGKTEEAMNMLLMVYNRTSGPEDFDKFVTKVWGDKNRKDVFPIWHYTNVMLAMLDTDEKKAEEMYTALNKCKNFTTDLQKGGLDGYPWNMILWNMSRWYRRTASAATADKYYKQALAITREHPEHLTMYSFSISMVADYLLYQRRKGEIRADQAEKEMRKVCEEFRKYLHTMPVMKEIFVPKENEKITEKVLERLSNAWLR